MKNTWYQVEGSKMAEFWTILHLPYTLMCLSFVAIGFGVAGVQRWDVFAWILLAYFFGLGIAAHAFDQWSAVRTGEGSKYVRFLTETDLLKLGAVPLTIAVYLGIFWMFELKAWHLFWIIPLQTFFVWAYPNNKFMGGFFHNDTWFAISWGWIPVIVGGYINTLTFELAVLGWAVIAGFIALIEITLSRYVRMLRKDFKAIPDRDAFKIRYTQKPELALKLLCFMTYMLAIAVLLT